MPSSSMSPAVMLRIFVVLVLCLLVFTCRQLEQHNAQEQQLRLMEENEGLKASLRSKEIEEKTRRFKSTTSSDFQDDLFSNRKQINSLDPKGAIKVLKREIDNYSEVLFVEAESYIYRELSRRNDRENSFGNYFFDLEKKIVLLAKAKIKVEIKGMYVKEVEDFYKRCEKYYRRDDRLVEYCESDVKNIAQEIKKAYFSNKDGTTYITPPQLLIKHIDEFIRVHDTSARKYYANLQQNVFHLIEDWAIENPPKHYID